jgi:flavin-dependent dehydrogenase
MQRGVPPTGGFRERHGAYGLETPTRLHHGAGLTNLEEEIISRWSWGRIVLVGDAAHKVNPNLGWGFDTSMQDIGSSGRQPLIQSTPL